MKRRITIVSLLDSTVSGIIVDQKKNIFFSQQQQQQQKEKACTKNGVHISFGGEWLDLPIKVKKREKKHNDDEMGK